MQVNDIVPSAIQCVLMPEPIDESDSQEEPDEQRNSRRGLLLALVALLALIQQFWTVFATPEDVSLMTQRNKWVSSDTVELSNGQNGRGKSTGNALRPNSPILTRRGPTDLAGFRVSEI